MKLYPARRLHTRSSEQIKSVLQTNLTAPIKVTRRLLPEMLRRGQGHIVHVSSLAGKVGIPHIAPYVASKYGLAGFNHCRRQSFMGAVYIHQASVQGMWCATACGLYGRGWQPGCSSGCV